MERFRASLRAPDDSEEHCLKEGRPEPGTCVMRTSKMHVNISHAWFYQLRTHHHLQLIGNLEQLSVVFDVRHRRQLQCRQLLQPLARLTEHETKRNQNEIKITDSRDVDADADAAGK